MDKVDAVSTDFPAFYVKEVEQQKPAHRVTVFGENNSNILEILGNKEKTLPGKLDVIVSDLELPKASRSGLLEKIKMTQSGDMTTDNIFLEQDSVPDLVVINIPTEDSFSSLKGNHYSYQYIYLDWVRTPPDKRPQVVMYTDNFKPQLYLKHDYQGFLFCSTPNELNDVLNLTEQIEQNKKTEIYNPKKLEVSQKDAYDNSDLREWENKTADTYQSLKFILERFNKRNGLFRSKYINSSYSDFGKDKDSLTPEHRINAVLDLGTGEGRIAGMLARCGYNVMGLDISKEQLDRSRTRVIEEGQGLRKEKEDLSLSYNTLEKIKNEGLDLTIDESDRETLNRYLTVQGSFFELQTVLNQTLVDWSSRYPETDQYEFFGANRYNEYAFSDERDMFADVGFDAVMFNWHTFCEIGSPENEKEVLEQILNVMWPGGELIIEIPDRMSEPYQSSLREYHLNHPDQPYGTIRDPKPNDFKGLKDDDLYPPRYFPDINELALLLKSIGYEINLDEDINDYNISYKNDGKEESFKEYLITARKSK